MPPVFLQHYYTVLSGIHKPIDAIRGKLLALTASLKKRIDRQKRNELE